MSKPDPKHALAAALSAGLGPTTKIDQCFGDDPEMLDMIRQAAAAKFPVSKIAELISTDECPISETAVRRWLKKNR